MRDFGELSPQQLITWRLQLHFELGGLLSEQERLEKAGQVPTDRYMNNYIGFCACIENMNEIAVHLRMKEVNTKELDRELYAPQRYEPRQVYGISSEPSVQSAKVTELSVSSRTLPPHIAQAA